jgi:hypothetical protein
MNKNYQQKGLVWGLLFAGLVMLLGGLPAVAQSGPYGNEWIVPGQQYYKLKVWRDGLYRLDYQYLQTAGITGVDPSRIQLWRRGREVAIYQGGNSAALDPTTYFEFYGQRNDGKLDAGMYKSPADQVHQMYSFYTDTASYFLTYSVGANPQPGRRMTQPVAAGGTPHPHRLINTVKLEPWAYLEPNNNSRTLYFPWIEKGEGFMSRDFGLNDPAVDFNDSLIRAVLPSPAPRLVVALVGGSNSPHSTDIFINTAGVPLRNIGTLNYSNFNTVVGSFTLQRTDLARNGQVVIRTLTHAVTPAPVPADLYRLPYFRLIAPQANRWYTNKRWLLFQNDSLLGGPATYEVDSIPATVRGYDVNDPWNVQRIDPTTATTTGPLGRRFVFPSATGQQTHWLFLADAARPLTPTPARPVRFRTINPVAPNYLIITHKKLMAAVPGRTANAARDYAAYRASVAGGGYDTLMVTTAQLYDQFHYGERSLLALRNFSLWMAANSTAARPKYLLLLGKGVTVNEYIQPWPTPTGRPAYTLTSYSIRERGELGLDLVPVSTRSVSDNFISSDFRNNDFVPKLPTGRVVAKTAVEVMDYLDKVRTHEGLGLAAWRKNALDLVGGGNAFEFGEFQSHMNRYKQRIEQPCFNGQVVQTYTRSTVNSTTSLPVTVNIATELNAGLSLITFLGHGSNTTFDLNIGNVSDVNNGYNNAGKYPMMFFNGCAAGLMFGNYPTFGEDWLLTANKGSIGLMAQTGFSYAHLLDPAQDSLYRRLLNTPSWYGKPVTLAQREVVRTLQRDPAFQNNEAIEQLLCTLWHGDPALKIYSPALPDFQTSDPQLSIAPGPGQTTVTANSTSLTLNIGVNNPGNFCTRTDSLLIRVTRQYGLSRPNTVHIGRFRLIKQTSATYSIELPNAAFNNIGVFGNNCFQVELDYANREPELSETNNAAQICYNFLQGGVTLLSPAEFAMVPTARPRLVAQTNDPSGTDRGYEFELDTVPTFNSPWRQDTIVRTTLTPSWKPRLRVAASGDSVVWYWRVRFQTAQPNEDASWVTSSFRVVPNMLGWSQSHYAQFRRDERQGVEVAVPTGRWSFTNELKQLVLRTRGGGAPRAAPTFTLNTGNGIQGNPSSPPYVSNCAIFAPNIMLAVYDKVTLQPKQVAGATLTCGQGAQQFYIFAADPATVPDTLNNINNSATRQAELSALLNNVSNGDYVALISMNRVRWSALPTSLKATLSSVLGSQLVNQLRNGDPLALLAQKLSTGSRLIREVGPSLAVGAPPRADQVIVLTDTLRTPSIRGKVISTRIGPAQQWQTLHHWVTKETATSSYNLRLFGINAAGVATELNPSVPTSTSLSSYSLAGFSAQTYPYLQLELTLKDSINRVAPQLQEWFIAYRGVPEGVVRRDLVAAPAYAPATLAAQAVNPGVISFPVKFENISTVDFGTPLKAVFSLHENSGGLPGRQVKAETFTINRPLRADSVLTFTASMNVVGLFGSFIPVVTVNPPGAGVLPEQSHFNNQLTLAPFTVIDTNLPPTLDVAIDGRHILNGELVSPTPAILIQLNDEDKLRHISSRSFFTLTLARPGLPAAVVNLTGSDVNFLVDSLNGSIAKLEYFPGRNAPLADGMYTLRVQGRDPSSVNAGAQDFEVKFEVVNASTITNVFPYPNPVTSKARFVFTVTGQELPQNMKIQIMTIAGRVVKEIFMGDLGPLHIGNNLTEYAWDGTDQFGDRLANGTYLYRVSLDDPQGKFSQRRTAGDQAFKNDWGKLVLMR